MNILLWILQILLALWNIIGAIYMLNNYSDIASNWAYNSIPGPLWIILGLLQVLASLGLILPWLMKKMPNLASLSAACLAIISLLGIALYDSYAGFPGLLWGIIPASLAAFVSFKRRQ